MPNDKPRRFPPPWKIDGNHTAFWIEDADGKKFGYTYFRESGWGRTSQGRDLTRDEARRIVSNIAKLPDLLKRG